GRIWRDPWNGVMGDRRWQGGIVAPSRTHGSTPDVWIPTGFSKRQSRKQEKSSRSWILLGKGSMASTSSGGHPFTSEWIKTCLHAGTTGSSPASWTFKQARGHGEVPAEDRQAVALYDALPSWLREFRSLSACAHAALGGLADQAGPGVSAAEAASEAETAVARLHQAVAMGYRNADALDPLRDRDDFRLLMMDLAFPAEPFDRTE